MATPEEILAFWFEKPALDAQDMMRKMRRWFAGGAEMDALIIERFASDVRDAVQGKLTEWEGEVRPRLALIVLLDQFTRNVYRDDAEMYAGDARAQRLAVETFDRGLDEQLSVDERHFAAMPFAHAEDVALQERSVRLAEQLVAEAPEALRSVYAMALEQSTKYLAVIRRFGRFPHRNQLLGRDSTSEELEFLRDWKERQPPSAMRQRHSSMR